MDIHSKTFASLAPELQRQWTTVWTDSAEHLDEGVVVREVVDDEDDPTKCVIVLVGPDVGEMRVRLSQLDLQESRHDVYSAELGVALTQARLATGF